MTKKIFAEITITESIEEETKKPVLTIQIIDWRKNKGKLFVWGVKDE